MTKKDGTRIQLCGQFVVRVEGRRIERELPGRQGRLLFTFLVLNRDKPQSRDELIEAIWPRELPSDPQGALSPLISKLRRLLPEGWLEGRSELRFMFPADAKIDVESAREAIHRAEALLDAERWDDACGPSLLAQNVPSGRCCRARRRPGSRRRGASSRTFATGRRRPPSAPHSGWAARSFAGSSRLPSASSRRRLTARAGTGC